MDLDEIPEGRAGEGEGGEEELRARSSVPEERKAREQRNGWRAKQRMTVRQREGGRGEGRARARFPSTRPAASHVEDGRAHYYSCSRRLILFQLCSRPG